MAIPFIAHLKKLTRQIGLRIYQRLLFVKAIKNYSDLIVMLVPGDGLVSGGILSIYAFYYSTKKLYPKKDVLICTYPNKSTSLRYKWFANAVNLINFDIILLESNKFKQILLHLPEYYVEEFINSLTISQVQQLQNVKNLHINVMNQNAEMMPTEKIFARLKEFTHKLSITTAHARYTTPELRAEYQAPVHLLSAWFEQNELTIIRYLEKKDILIVSPDFHPMKESILIAIRSAMPHVEQIVIQNMKYDDYKKLESIAKWAISFGEGFDGYTIFPALKGGITFSVYNELFFPTKYKQIKTFYDSYESMKKNIIQDMRNLDNEKDYENFNNSMRQLLEQDYSYSSYEKKVIEFYNQDYTFK